MGNQAKSGRFAFLSQAGGLADLALEPGRLDAFLATVLAALRERVPFALGRVSEGSEVELIERCTLGEAVGSAQDGLASPEVRRVLDRGEPRRRSATTAGGAARAQLLVPLLAGKRTLGLLSLERDGEPFAAGELELATACAELISLALVTAHQAARLESERARLAERNRLLEGEVSGTGYAGARLDGFASAAAQELASAARRVAVTEAPVLITGETGSGKEVLARAIHGWSRRANGPFVKLNCAALPEGLVESELFGHRRGAFSGAIANRPGRFSVANGGTLLLDEIGDLPAGAQAKLLRVLQEGSFEPVGSDETVRVDVRILAATHVDLELAIEQRRFREDLFYRLNVLSLHVPPLRERSEDLGRLSREILADIARRTGRGPWQLPPGALERLRAYPWPGNVRELVNALERAVALAQDGELRVNVPEIRKGLGARRGAGGPGHLETLEEVERRHVQRVLEATGGKLYGPGGAAEVLGLKPSTLQSRMKKLGIRRRPDLGAPR